jgi:hypothetical protein
MGPHIGCSAISLSAAMLGRLTASVAVGSVLTRFRLVVAKVIGN